ncbi:MAG: hypothetical protein R3222_06505 [Balneolaceae bacterium]|nr:hypothetical protein [Balneolaceae bacterium]
MNRELNPKNYKRISLINWLLTVPLVVLFAVPYLSIATFINAHTGASYVGALLFSVPFCLTIMHGHVTMALGSLHRNHYYEWLENNTLTYGLFFHPMFTSTRFRLILLVISVIILFLGWVIQY